MTLTDIDKSFIHLRLHSSYSLSEGAVKTEKLIELCEQNNMPAVAVTDTNNLFGCLEFSTKLSEHGIQYIVGCQLNVKHPCKIDHPTSILLYAKNQNGYKNLIQLVTSSYLNSTSEEYPEISLDTLGNFSEDLIIATGGVYGSLGALLLNEDFDKAKEYLEFLQKKFNNRLYIELSRHHNFNEQKIENDAIDLAYDYNIPLLATNNVCFPLRDDFEAHDALICIAQTKTIYDGDRKTSSSEFYFKPPEEMIALFNDLPEAIENTGVLAQRCAFCLHKIKPYMPQFKTAEGKTQEQTLRDMATEGLEKRLKKLESREDYTKIRPLYFNRMEYELSVIEKMGFSGYFLIVADYVCWAKSQNIPVGPGRGSGAGSIVAWSIKITDVDPIRFKLFFERFLNPDRVSMPDFDVDFCQERRDEVMYYVQRKYGYESVAQIITFGKLQARAVVKDIGRVLALPYGFVDKISKLIPFNPTNPVTLQDAVESEKALRDLRDSDPQVNKLLEIALRLEGLNRHASVHAAGVVISDKILKYIVPLYKDHRSVMPVTQFSMKYVESAGLIKFDFLGLKTLTVIQKTLDFIKNRGVNLNSQDIPFDDENTFKLMRKVNCVGVFQIESSGMREVLRRLQPDKIEDLIALVALYRPGPMDDIPKYIACKHGDEPITYLHEKLKPILEETYGVMVYQEQVMQIAQEIAGYTLGQADILRRAMGKKNKEEMKAQKSRFIEGAVSRGIDLGIAETLFEQMSKFASYGFNKSHSTPYGILTYQTAYLKANYMIEFFAAIMTLDSSNSEKLYDYQEDAKKNGINITLPDINLSESDFVVDYENNSIRYSLTAIKGSGEQVVDEIVRDRKEHGNYKSVFDFYERLSKTKLITRKNLENYIKAGAFDSLHPNRRQLFESIPQIMSMKDDSDQGLLFERPLPKLVDVPEWADTEKLQNEFDVIGFYISDHPMRQYEAILKELRFPTLAEAKEYPKTSVVVIINDVAYKTTKNQSRFCILRVSDATGTAEVSLFSEVLANYGDLLEVGNIVVLNIICNGYGDQLRIIAEKVQIFDENFSHGIKYHFNHSSSLAQSLSQESKHKIMRIKINGLSELQKIKNFINNFRKDGTVKLELIFGDGKKVILPEKYFLTTYDILDIRTIVGVDNVDIIEDL
ncbi:MAG: DNA polymerase III subunit alpha [Alphaproteobacteria bacterium]|nr:DNA polymerase III subunit alpha [Alphaproteobacteria bacterium]